MSDCAKSRTRKTTMPFHCRYPRGHEGKCSPFTLHPMTRERWAELKANPVPAASDMDWSDEEVA